MTTNPVLVSAIAEQYRIEREFGGGGTRFRRHNNGASSARW
jgi:hypothetical protein